MTDQGDKPAGTMNAEEIEQFRKRWDDRLGGAEPMMSHLFDQTTTAIADRSGALVLDCPCFGLAGFDRLGVVRIVLTPEATQTLRLTLHNAEKSGDFPALAPVTRKAN